MQVQATSNYQPAAWQEPGSIPVRASTLGPVRQELTQALPEPELTLAQVSTQAQVLPEPSPELPPLAFLSPASQPSATCVP